MYQRDRNTNPRRGFIPANAYQPTEEDRKAELLARVESLPPESITRDILIGVLRREFGVEVG